MKTKVPLVVLVTALLVLLGAVPAFAQNPTYTLEITAGDDQSAAVTESYATLLQVTVKDANGAPAPGVSVTFTAPPFGASVFLDVYSDDNTDGVYLKTRVYTTDENGVASVKPTAGCTPGAVQVTASVGDQSVTFNLTNGGTTPAYCLDSSWVADPLMPGTPPPAPDTPADAAVEGWWWRDTATQAKRLQHDQEQFTDTIVRLYTSPSLNVYVYISAVGTNVTLFTNPTTNKYFIVGCGGGADEASYAKSRFSPYLYGKTLKGVVITSTSPEDLWGCKVWTKGSLAIPIYASSGFADDVQKQYRVSEEFTERYEEFWGTNLPWSADGFLGSGIMKEYRAVLPQFWQYPTATISQSTDITFDGNVIRLIPTGASTDGLMVYLPAPGILYMGEFIGPQLPDVGMLPNPGYTIQSLIDSLDLARSLVPNILILKTGKSITGPSETLAFLLAQRDVLLYIRDQTLIKINLHYTLDEIAATLKLPVSFTSSPYLKEYASDVPSIVREVWNEYLGWWGGNPTELASTLTEDAKAQALADALGGVDSLIDAARQAELNARDLQGAEKALYLADAAYRVAPDNFEAKQIYAQTLRKNAFMQVSAYKRNYYISAANSLGTEQQVSDILKTGTEDTALAFTGQEFVESFNGIGGAALATVRIDSLPDPMNGALTLAGAEVTAGQEIAVAELGGLVFTPVGDWNGSTSFLWNGKDGSGYAADPASVRITLEPVNDPPFVSSAMPLGDLTEYEGNLAYVLVPLADGFEDIDGDELAYTVVSSEPGLFPPTVNGSDLELAFLPDWWGTVTFTVTATDPEGESATDDFKFTIYPVNDTPLTMDAEITIVAGMSQSIILVYGDLETAQANLVVTGTPTHGTLSGVAPNLTYTVPIDFSGDDSFTYTVADRGDPDGCTGEPTTCSAPLSATGTVHVTVLAAPSGSISGMVYNDANADGQTDSGEGGLAGITLQLKDASDNVIKTATSSSDGTYNFTGLTAGSYKVSATIDSARAQTTPNPASVTLGTDSTAVIDFNFGSLLPAGSISGLVFNDANGNGSLDSGETGLASVTVTLQDANGNKTQAITAGDGTYAFTGLYAGTYQVSEVLDRNRVQTTANPAPIPLTITQTVTGVNFGSVVSADLKVSMTYSINSKKIILAITITNDGPADALNATLTDALPDSVAYISVVTTQGTCTGGKTINCNFGTIASGGSATVTLQVNRVNTKVAVVNAASVVSSIFDVDTADNSATVTIP